MSDQPALDTKRTMDQTAPEVLIVDPSGENRDVIKTLLDLRGVRTHEAADAGRGMELLAAHRPRVVVLDTDVAGGREWEIQEIERRSRDQRAAVVLLGRLRSRAREAPHEQIVDKPYQYGPLLRTIEGLLAG